jgi:hypothetical protein
MSIQVKIEGVYGEFISATKLMADVFGGLMDGMKQGLKEMSDEAKADMKGHESATEQFANILKNNMKGVTGAVEGVKIAWAQLAVIFEAGHFLKDAVQETIAATVESQKLGRALGVSATQASYLKVAIGDVHGTTDQFINVAKGLDAQVRKNEKAMNDFGLQTRDASGHLKDQQTLTLDALEVLRGYKEGTDRNIAATQLFGKGVNVTSEMLALNAEKLAAAKEKADAFGLATGKDDVDAANKFRDAMNDMHDIFDAVMKAVGSALLPVLNDLAQWFLEDGPTALMAVKIAIDIVISLFKGLAFAAKAAWEVLQLAFTNMSRMATGFGQVFYDVMHGDFAGAKDAASSMVSDMSTNIGESFQRIMDKASATTDSLSDMWGKVINPGKTPDSGTENGGTEDADIAKKPKKHSGAAEARREAAEQRRLLKEKYDMVMESYKGEEQAARDNLTKVLEIQKKELVAATAMYGEKSKQAIDAANRVAETQRKIDEQQAQMDLRRAESHRAIMRMQIDNDQRDAEAQQQMGEITYAKLIELERGYEDQRYQLERQSLEDEAAMNIDRIADHQATLLKLEELDQAHENRLSAITTQGALERNQTQKQVEGVMASGFANAIMGMVKGTMTFKQAMKSMFSSILQGLVQMLVQWAAKMAAHYIMDRIMHKANLTAKKAAEKVAAASSIATNAALAGSAGTASFAGAPWPIDIGAPAFGAAMAAAAGAFGVGLAAEQGFDVPAGMNPVTQLHQKEMVLPAAQAQVIRDMADSGVSGAGGDHYHIHGAHDAQSFMDFLRRNPGQLSSGFKYAVRMGHLVGVKL